jgi:hypothetical protein
MPSVKAAVNGTQTLQPLKSVVGLAKEKRDAHLLENESMEVEKVIELREGLKPGQVREERS